jgi:carboxypeptidase C (cathepsin A)
MNIPTTVQTFTLCSDSVGDNYHPEPEGSKWIYTVLRHKIKILFYSGDTDGALPTYGTKTWINSLNWARINNTEQWYLGDQVAGYLEKYDGLDLATVHGTGHMAPEWKPEQVSKMITAWIHDE